MRPGEALPILKVLADGVNPVTGKAYPEDSPYAEPRVLRALFCAVDHVQREVDKERKRERTPVNFGKPWEAGDDAKLRQLFAVGESLYTMGQALQRTQGSVRLRLEKMGLISRATP